VRPRRERNRVSRVEDELSAGVSEMRSGIPWSHGRGRLRWLLVLAAIGLAVVGGRGPVDIAYGGPGHDQGGVPATTGGQTPTRCTNADLRGTFAFKVTDGQVFLPSDRLIAAAFIGDATFDGQGRIVQGQAIEAQSGVLDSAVTYTGTYSVEPTCRASLVINATHTSPPGQHVHHVALRLLGRPGYVDKFYFIEVTGQNNPPPGIVNLVGEGERMPVTIGPGN
jgi:hypothetical protein